MLKGLETTLVPIYNVGGVQTCLEDVFSGVVIIISSQTQMVGLINQYLASHIMAKSRKILRMVTAVVWGASIATVALSLYTAQAGYQWGPLAYLRTYNAILAGSAVVLATVIMVGLLTVRGVNRTSRQIVESMVETLGVDSSLPVNLTEVEIAVKEELQTVNSPKAQELQQTLQKHKDLQTFRRDIRSLLAAPVGLLSVIFAISAAWAVPATGTLLETFSFLNTTLLFFVAYGMAVAVASIVAGAVALRSSRKTIVA